MNRFVSESTDPEQVVRQFKQWEPEMRALRRVIITQTETTVEDLNRDRMLFQGVTFGTPALRALFQAIGMQSDPRHLEEPPANQLQREFRITARYPWGHDRIL